MIVNRLVMAAWIDPDTPMDRHSTKSLAADDTRDYKIIFSDEFETDGRSFDDGEDPRWTSLDKNDCKYVTPKYDINSRIVEESSAAIFYFEQDTNNALHYYRR